MARRSSKKKDFFWLSYSDLMTSLFFVMLVLFVLAYTNLSIINEELERRNKIIEELTVAKIELDRIKEIEKTVNNIDKRFFRYDSLNKKHILNVQFLFGTGSSNLADIKPDRRPELIEAGRAIKDLVLTFPEEENIKYLVVVEGQASKDGWEGNSNLSYFRAGSLIKLWEENNIGLENLKNCEIVIAGSGEKGLPRDEPDVPPANQRFLITIVPKIGEIRQR